MKCRKVEIRIGVFPIEVFQTGAFQTGAFQTGAYLTEVCRIGVYRIGVCRIGVFQTVRLRNKAYPIERRRTRNDAAPPLPRRVTIIAFIPVSGLGPER